jgi:oleandomycin transport system permease protein
MTAVTLPPGADPALGGRPFPLVRHSLSLAYRTILRIRRTPEQLFDVTFQPIIFIVLFVYLFGGAIAGSTHEYLQYVLPALMVQTVLFSSMTIGVNLNTDIGKGVFDRFRSLPIPRSAPLVGAVLGDVVRYLVSIVVIIAFGYAIGFRVQTDPLRTALAALVLVVFSLCLCWVSVLIGMVVREPGGVQGISFMLMFPLTFGSNMFVPGRHDAGLAAGLGPREPRDAPDRDRPLADDRRPGGVAAGADPALVGGDPRGVRAARRPLLPAPHLASRSSASGGRVRRHRGPLSRGQCAAKSTPAPTPGVSFQVRIFAATRASSRFPGGTARAKCA